MKLYGYPNSRATRALWALEEAQVEYQYVHVDLKNGAGRAADYLAINAGGKVPTLVDGDVVITESAAICLYLGDKFARSGLLPPAGTRARGECYRWVCFALSELEQPLWTIAKHRFVLPEERRVPAIMQTAFWEFSVAANVLAQELGNRCYAAGEDFSAADILLGHTLAWARSARIELGHDTLNAYAERVLGRATLARARERASVEAARKAG
jgi:glutathione S-transferase